VKTIKRIIPTLVVAVGCMASIAVAETNETLSARQKKIIPIAAFTASGNMSKLEIGAPMVTRFETLLLAGMYRNPPAGIRFSHPSLTSF
jgi:hypothetical protein